MGAKSTAYRNADLFVLPTHSKIFGMVVAEALAHECPAIVSQGAPWSHLESEGCGWWIENSVESLAHGLESALCTDISQLRQMGQNGRQWMKRDFSWQKIAESMSEAYQWLKNGGNPPDSVRLT